MTATRTATTTVVSTVSVQVWCWIGDHAYLDPEERQELLWEVLQKIIGEVRWCSGFEFANDGVDPCIPHWMGGCKRISEPGWPGNWNVYYDDSYSELLKEFLLGDRGDVGYGKEIKTYPRCSQLINDLMKLEVVSIVQRKLGHTQLGASWGSIRIWLTFGTLINSVPQVKLAHGVDCWCRRRRWRRERLWGRRRIHGRPAVAALSIGWNGIVRWYYNLRWKK